MHVIPYVDLLQYLSNGQNEQHRNSKLSKEDMKQTLTILFLYNAEVRSAL